MEDVIEEPIQQRELRIFAKSTFLEALCSHVANGGSPVEYAELLDVRYDKMQQWIYADKARYERYGAALGARDEWSKQTVLRELQHIATSDIRKIFHEDGSLKPMSDWPEEVARAVASVEVYEVYERDGRQKVQVGWTKKVKFWDKRAAIELIGKNLGLFVERHKHDLTVMTLEQLVLSAQAEGTKNVTGTNTGAEQRSLPENTPVRSE